MTKTPEPTRMRVAVIGNGTATHYVIEGRTACGRDASKATVLEGRSVAVCMRCRKATR